jgi:hypothetical protein
MQWNGGVVGASDEEKGPLGMGADGFTCEISRPRESRDISTIPGVNHDGRFVISLPIR